MGLDTSHGCWHGAYSSFTRFRNKLAKAAGIQVEKVTYGDGYSGESPLIDWTAFPDGWPQGEWGETVPTRANGKPEPLLFLIAHSDCDGVIHPAQGVQLAQRLEELLPAIRETEEVKAGDPDRLVEKTQAFIAGLRDAADAGEDVDFH